MHGRLSIPLYAGGLTAKAGTKAERSNDLYRVDTLTRHLLATMCMLNEDQRFIAILIASLYHLDLRPPNIAEGIL
jgi:hypothetical protein